MPRVYAKAAENLKRMIDAGVMMRDAALLLRLPSDLARPDQTGLACVASLADYATNRIRKHELTTPVKEDDRVRQIEAVNAQTGPVMLAYPAAADRRAARQAAAGTPPGRRHRRRRRAPPALGRFDAAAIDKLTNAFDALPALYIADGHHRSAAAARVAQARKTDGYFLSVIFPDHEMTILDYNRVVKDLNGRTPEQLLAELGQSFTVAAQPSRCARPPPANSACISTADGTIDARPNCSRAIRSAACRSPC